MIKNKIIILLVALMLLVVGCNKQEELYEKQGNDVEVNVLDTTSRQINYEDIYGLYEEKLDDVKALYEANNIAFSQARNTDGVISLYYRDITKNNPNDIAYAEYTLLNNDDGGVEYILASLSLVVDSNSVFKLEDTVLKGLSSILISEDIDYTEVNAKINEVLSSNTSDKIVNDYNGIKEDIVINNDSIRYRIRGVYGV